MRFQFKTQPYRHQAKEFDEHKNDPARALLWQMRTGKTKVMIDTAAYQFCQGAVTGVIVLAPNGVHNNWIKRELPVHCSVPYKFHVYRAASVKTKWHQAGVNVVCNKAEGHLSFLALNSESIRTESAQKVIKQFLRAHKGKVFLIVDESHDFRTPGSRRTRVARSLAKHCAFRRILSGTAVSNTPLAAWSQFEILEPGALGFRTFGDFKAHHAIYRMARTKGGRQFEQLVDYANLDELKDKIGQWSSVVLREDCDDMPDLSETITPFTMGDKQRKIYDRLVKDYILEDAGYDGGARLLKLQQITRGWYKDEFGDVVNVVSDEHNPALQALERDVSSTDNKIIIWCQFREDIAKVSALMKRMGIDAVEYHGGIKPADREKAIDNFMRFKKFRVFIGQPQAGGVGLNLSAASTIIWYSHTQDLIIREQASERATKVGGRVIDIIDYECDDSVDGLVLTSHRNKRNVADDVAGLGLKYTLEMEAFI